MLIFGILLVILIHELGHYTMAKLVGFEVKGVTLLLFRKKPLFDFKVKGTRLKIGWIPLGGYTEFEDKEAEVWKWVLVLWGGCLFNLIFGLTILWGHGIDYVLTYFFCITNGIRIEETIYTFWDLTAFISIILGLINTLPLKGFDGEKIKQMLKD